MDNPNTLCDCDVCKGVNTHKAKSKDGSTSLGRQVSSRPTRGGIVKGPQGRPSGIRGRPPLERGPVDNDGLPDHLIRWLTLLKSEGTVERDFKELPSLEHHLENAILASTTAQLATYPSFAPRVGELVLWYKNLDGELQRDPGNGHYKIYDPNTKVFKGYPRWLGGVVTQIPVTSEPLTLEDIEGKESQKLLAVNSSGFRIECLPDVNSEDKSLTKQYSHVPLSHIRPLGLWQDLIPTEHVLNSSHLSLKNILKATRTINLIGKYKLVGMWPDAYIFAKGIFLGAECHWAGDVVRLSTREGEKDVGEVMHIHSFILSLKGLQPEPDNYTAVTGDRCDTIHILVRGQVYTRNPPNNDNNSTTQSIDLASLPEVMRTYGPWYPSSSITSRAAAATHHNLPAPRILSRLSSLQSTSLLHPSSSPQSLLNTGLQSLLDARMYALKFDKRLDTVAGKPWHWTDTRAVALDIETFNGLDVGERYDRERDVGRMQRVLEVVKREQGEVVAPAATMIDVGTGDTRVETGMGGGVDDFERKENGKGKGKGMKGSGMVMAAVKVDSDDDNDEDEEEDEVEGDDVVEEIENMDIEERGAKRMKL